MESVNQGSRRSPEIGLAGSRALPRDRLAAMLCHRGCAEIRCATRSRSLEEGSYAALCHSAIRVRLSREGRPSGFHHEFGLIVGRCDGCELAKLLGAGYIGLLASETDRDQRRRDRGIRLLHCHFVRRAAGVHPPQLKPTIMVRMLPTTAPQTPALSHARCIRMEQLLRARSVAGAVRFR